MVEFQLQAKKNTGKKKKNKKGLKQEQKACLAKMSAFKRGW